MKPPATIKVPKSSFGTKEIVKGAIVGGIIAGEVGAAVLFQINGHGASSRFYFYYTAVAEGKL